MILFQPATLPATTSAGERARLDPWSRTADLVDALDEAMLSRLTVGGTLREAAEHHLLSGGKRLRGRLVLAAGASLDLGPDQLLDAAAAVELLHAASLAHDDLQDGDRMRRGREAVWSKYGRDVALLLGDGLIASSMAAVAAAPSPAVGSLISDVAQSVWTLAEGQVLDTTGRPSSCSRERYAGAARRKTGQLLALSLRLPMRIAGQPEASLRAARRAAGWLGVAYQIQDDVADLAGSKGRPRGSDLLAGCPSAVVVEYALACDDDERERFLRRLDERGLRADELEQVIDRILGSNALPTCLLHQRAVVRRVRDNAAKLPLALRDTVHEVSRETLEQSVRLAEVALRSSNRVAPATPADWEVRRGLDRCVV